MLKLGLRIYRVNMIVVYIPLTKCRDTLPLYDRKNTSLNLICCHSFAFAFTEQNIKARLNRYIIILEGSV